MKVLDFLGNELSAGDAVAVDMAHVVGVIQKIEDGQIARGLVLDGQPKGEILPPHLVIHIQATQAMLIQAPPNSPVGQVMSVVKVQKPEEKK